MRTIEINGNNFSNLTEFYDEMERKMTSGLNWKIGRNMDAFDDFLNGGFGVHDIDKKYKLNWKNSKKSKTELNWTETMKFIEAKLKACHPTNIEFVNKDLENAKSGIGKTLFELIIEIIKEYKQIELKLN